MSAVLQPTSPAPPCNTPQLTLLSVCTTFSLSFRDTKPLPTSEEQPLHWLFPPCPALSRVSHSWILLDTSSQSISHQLALHSPWHGPLLEMTLLNICFSANGLLICGSRNCMRAGKFSRLLTTVLPVPSIVNVSCMHE